MKVLFILDHAPNYREGFLRELGNLCDLTVISHSCERDNLQSPTKRKGYKYYEVNKTIGNTIRINFQLLSIIRKIHPDLICCALNLRYPIRVLSFLTNPDLQKKWVWWGQIYGKNDNTLLTYLKTKLIIKSRGALVYTEEIENRLALNNVVSFNNSQFSKTKFKKLDNIKSESLNCLFVGRPQKRKKLELLIHLANQRKDLNIRVVGPNTNFYFKNYKIPDNLKLYPEAHGDRLVEHFNWSNIVVNPGHIGLLVMNAACHNRPIVIHSKVKHAPEVILAKDAKQFFIDFEDNSAVNDFLNKILKDHNLLINKGEELYYNALSKYTIEKMAENHYSFFRKILHNES